jgi:hypothetical protein
MKREKVRCLASNFEFLSSVESFALRENVSLLTLATVDSKTNTIESSASSSRCLHGRTHEAGDEKDWKHFLRIDNAKRVYVAANNVKRRTEERS